MRSQNLVVAKIAATFLPRPLKVDLTSNLLIYNTYVSVCDLLHNYALNIKSRLPLILSPQASLVPLRIYPHRDSLVDTWFATSDGVLMQVPAPKNDSPIGRSPGTPKAVSLDIIVTCKEVACTTII
jgi:hypothetical protein